MELTKLFATIAVALVSLIGILGWINFYAISYNISNVGATFNQTTTHIQSITNATIIGIGDQTANNTYAQSGGGSSASSTNNLVYRGLAIISVIPSMIGLVPAMFQDAASILGIPETYLVIGTAVFLFSIAILLAYIFILGAKTVGR